MCESGFHICVLISFYSQMHHLPCQFPLPLRRLCTINGSEFLPRCAHSPIKFGFVGTNMCTESGTGLVYFFFYIRFEASGLYVI